MEFTYRFRAYLFVNLVAVASIAATVLATTLPVGTQVVLWGAWFVVVQLVAAWFMVQKKVPLMPDDLRELIEQYRAEAAEGDRIAQLVLGRAYEEGVIVECDLEQARHWYRRAAEQHLDEAERALERLHAA